MRNLLIAVAILGLVATPVLADWNVGDPHKMHYPQLPKVNGGWDVKSSYYLFLADDWRCTETGPVKDIHTWVSFKNDQWIMPSVVHLAIWSDDPVGFQGVPGEDPGNNFSKPLQQLWHKDRTVGQWTTRLWAEGPQGWFDPRYPGQRIPPPDHYGVYQMNFLFDEMEAFRQEYGKIYWLEFTIQQPVEVNVGWKESADHFNDAAVWRILGEPWNELRDPMTGALMDLAFVITPEPGGLIILALGSLAMLRRRAA